MKPKVIAQAGSRYIIQMDEYNVVIAYTQRKERTGLMWEALLCKFDGWDFEYPKEPVPPVEELLAYPLLKGYRQGEDPDYSRYTPERHGSDHYSKYPPVLKMFQR